MKSQQKIFFLILAFSMISPRINAQVFTERLGINPIQYDTYEKRQVAIAKRSFLRKSTTNDTLTIPFADDFSGNDISWAPTRYNFGQPIHSIRFIGNQKARAFGEMGISLRTNSRGSVWNNIGTDLTRDFLSVSNPLANEPNKLWSCGRRGWIAYSSDTGNTWTPVTSDSLNNRNLAEVSFFTFEKGLVIDSTGKMFRTGNQGTTWTPVALNAPWPRFKARSVAWANENRVVAGGESGKIATSNDGGNTFLVDSSVFTKFRNYRKIKFFTDKFGLAVGDSGLIYKTLDGGSNWVFTHTTGSETLLDVDVNVNTNDRLVWAIGEKGTLLYSQTKGDSWSPMSAGTTEDLLSISLVNEYRGWIGTRKGRLIQVIVDPLRPYSRYWEPNSGVFINNSFTPNPLTKGVATFDGLNNKGMPYSSVEGKSGGCDTLTSTYYDLFDFQGTNVYLSFFYQPGNNRIQLIPDPEDSLVLQFQGPKGYWQSFWNAKGISDSILTSQFKYVSITLPDSLNFPGFRFRFINYGNQNGNFDLWHLDFVRLDNEHDQTDSLQREYALSKPFNRLMKSYSALPMEQLRYILNNNLTGFFNENLESEVVNFNPFAQTNITGDFFLRHLAYDSSSEPETQPLEMVPLFTRGISRKPAIVPIESFRSKLKTDQYYTFEFGISLDDDNTNTIRSNDTLTRLFNASTIMSYDDGTAELVRGVGGNSSIGAVKFYLPVTDTLTDIQLFFARTPQNLQQTISFSLLLIDSVNIETNTGGETALARRQFVLPPTSDSVNKFITFDMRDAGTLNNRILKGGRHFYVGWQQPAIDNSNEVRLGCDINSSNPGSFHIKSGQVWSKYTFDDFPLMIRPVFGPVTVTSVKKSIGKPTSPFFPNPATNQIRNRQRFNNLEIFNTLGQSVIQVGNGTPDQEIQLNLVPGIYTLRWIETNGNPVSQRIIVE